MVLCPVYYDSNNPFKANDKPLSESTIYQCSTFMLANHTSLPGPLHMGNKYKAHGGILKYINNKMVIVYH
jgi:hypothetical protein